MLRTTTLARLVPQRLCVSCTTRCMNTRAMPPDEYELRVGYAISTLQEELPSFFYKGLQDHGIYSPHVVLSDPHYTRLSLKGKTAYLGASEMLRWSMDCYFDQVDVDITRIRVLPEDPSATQPPDATDAPSDNASSLNRCSRTSSAMLSTIPHHHRIPPSPPSAANAANSSISAYTSSLPLHEHSHQRRLFASLANDTQLPIVVHYGAPRSHVDTRPSAKIRCLEIRWQLQARPRSIFSPATNSDDERPRKHVEGVFIYTFDAQGFIAEHKIQRIEPSPSRRILLMHSYGSKIRAFLESLKRRTEPELRPGLG